MGHYTPAPGGGPSPEGSVILPEVWALPPAVPTAFDDEFNDGSINAAWYTVDEAGKENSWYEPVGVKGLSAVFVSGKSSHSTTGKLKSFTGLTPPFYIETAAMIISRDQQYPGVGLIFADGVTYGAGAQVLGQSNMSSNYINMAKYTNYNNRESYTEYSLHPGMKIGRIYLRLVWSATNTFYLYYSPDGVVWNDVHGAMSYTLTPTYFGVFASSFDSSNYPFLVNFAYFRVREGAPGNG